VAAEDCVDMLCMCAWLKGAEGGWLAGRQAPKAAYLGNQPIIRGLKLNYTLSVGSWRS
jgi:hypothetical protein